MAEPVAPVAAPAPAPVAAPAAAPPAVAAAPAGGVAKPENLMASAPAAEAAPATADEQRAFLVSKGAKADELTALDEASLKAKYDEAKKAAPAEEKKPSEVKPEEIEVKAPDGVEFDEATLKSFKEIVADAKLSPSERAQKLVDMHVEALAKATSSSMDHWYKTQADWQKTWKSDPEIGGEHFDEGRAVIGKVLAQYGGAEEKQIREAMDLTGAGNNPYLGKLIVRMGRALVEGGGITGNAPGSTRSPADLLYPTANAA